MICHLHKKSVRLKPDAKHIFIQSIPYSSRLIRHRNSKDTTPDFSPEWIMLYKVVPPRNNIRDNPKNNDTWDSPYALLQDNSTYIELNFIPEMPDFLYGCFKNDALMVLLERNIYGGITRITLWFFEGMKQQYVEIHNQWISCQLILN